MLGSAVVIGLRPCDFYDLSLDELEDIFEAHRKFNNVDENNVSSLTQEDVKDLNDLLKKY